MSSNISPKRGQIWRVNFDPTIGSEIKKRRPAVVISSDAVGKLPIKLVIPITGWDDRYANNVWHVKLPPKKSNGLTKVSAVDALQTRCVSVERFIEKIGQVSSTEMEEITAALVAVIEYE